MLQMYQHEALAPPTSEGATRSSHAHTSGSSESSSKSQGITAVEDSSSSPGSASTSGTTHSTADMSHAAGRSIQQLCDWQRYRATEQHSRTAPARQHGLGPTGGSGGAGPPPLLACNSNDVYDHTLEALLQTEFSVWQVRRAHAADS